MRTPAPRPRGLRSSPAGGLCRRRPGVVREALPGAGALAEHRRGSPAGPPRVPLVRHGGWPEPMGRRSFLRLPERRGKRAEPLLQRAEVPRRGSFRNDLDRDVRGRVEPVRPGDGRRHALSARPRRPDQSPREHRSRAPRGPRWADVGRDAGRGPRAPRPRDGPFRAVPARRSRSGEPRARRRESPPRGSCRSPLGGDVRRRRPGEGGGRNRLDRSKGRFTRLTSKEGLPSDSIHGILEDERVRLWISTVRGLSCFDPREGTFHTYDSRDGLQADEFNGGAVYRSSRGEMFFGGIHGFSAFFPSQIAVRTDAAPVVLTELLLFNRPVAPGERIGGRVPRTRFVDIPGRDRPLPRGRRRLHRVRRAPLRRAREDPVRLPARRLRPRRDPRAGRPARRDLHRPGARRVPLPREGRQPRRRLG